MDKTQQVKILEVKIIQVLVTNEMLLLSQASVVLSFFLPFILTGTYSLVTFCGFLVYFSYEHWKVTVLQKEADNCDVDEFSLKILKKSKNHYFFTSLLIATAVLFHATWII